MKKLLINLTLITLSSGSFYASAKPWSKYDSPEYFLSIINRAPKLGLSGLPITGKISNEKLAWSDTNWPSSQGGTANRWNARKTISPWKYHLYSLKELLLLDSEKKSELSPTELFDISMGNYNYPLTKKVLSMTSPEDSWWEGICHGWSVASLNYPEPQPLSYTNKDGVKLELGSSDLKALLSLHEAFNSDKKAYYVRSGERCSQYGKVKGEAYEMDFIANGYDTQYGIDDRVLAPDYETANKPNCSDVNAGAFHLIITNMIGIHSTGFIADIDRYSDVWNHPVTGYDVLSMEKVSELKVKVRLDMHYTELLEIKIQEYAKSYSPELRFVSKLPVLGTDNQVTSTRHYEYILELNKEGQVIGGEWISETRPDFIWLQSKANEFNNSKLPLKGLKLLMR